MSLNLTSPPALCYTQTSRPRSGCGRNGAGVIASGAGEADAAISPCTTRLLPPTSSRRSSSGRAFAPLLAVTAMPVWAVPSVVGPASRRSMFQRTSHRPRERPPTTTFRRCRSALLSAILFPAGPDRHVWLRGPCDGKNRTSNVRFDSNRSAGVYYLLSRDRSVSRSGGFPCVTSCLLS